LAIGGSAPSGVRVYRIYDDFVDEEVSILALRKFSGSFKVLGILTS
jgi:hypothetical protein